MSLQQFKNNCIDYIKISATVVCIMFILFNMYYGTICGRTLILYQREAML